MNDANDEIRGKWLICVDTGGTFTDCLAVDAEGVWHRAKVLSSSALRGVATGNAGESRVVITENWNVPTPFALNFTFRLLDGSRFTSQVVEHKRGLLRLDTPLPHRLADGTPFEVVAPYEAPILAARLVTSVAAGESLPPHTLRLATTRGTNALLTRTGTPPAFFVTSGHADLIVIGTQQRPDLFALDITRPAPLYHSVIEVPERLNADGSVLRALDETAVRVAADRLFAQGVRTAAVCLLHAYRNPEHEQRVAALLREIGFTHISLSSELAPFIKALPRAQTAIVNAYLAPLLEDYVDAVSTALSRERAISAAKTTLYLMTSAGGLVSATAFRPKDSLLSGPAGGIVGAATAGRLAGFERIIAFDMGGTSTDVARYDGGFEYSFEHSVGDAHLVAPALGIESVAAGGGSVCIADKHGLRVGPESAGANPGPACYGAGGPLTITDVNLLLGRILPDRFEIPLSLTAAEKAADDLLAALERETGVSHQRDAVLHGLLDIANERMADAIRKISVRRGYDPAEYALVSFGGAGGQHACAVAGLLGIRTVIVPPDASLLSAFGLAHAVVERFAERQALRILGENDITEADLYALCQDLTADALQALTDEGATNPQRQRTLFRLRLLGQETSLDIEPDNEISLAAIFAARYAALYGHPPPQTRPIEVESVRVIVAAHSHPPAASSHEPTSKAATTPHLLSTGVPLYDRVALPRNAVISGPALIVERHSILAVEPGWTCRLYPESGALLLELAEPSWSTNQDRANAREREPYPDAHSDAAAPNTQHSLQRSSGDSTPFLEELFAARFAAIAVEMGEALRRTALSTNVKERLDFSCAVLNANGELIATAAHIPVHLGALGVCVRQVKEAVPLRPGDAIVTNHPAFGGSHLPDVTVITPVFDDTNALLGFVANRAHHAEIGGTRPGSMPPDAKTLSEEGVVIPPFYVIEQGVSRLDELCNVLTSAPYPTRAVADNRADLEAALAANHRGAMALGELARAHGSATIAGFMDAITARSERLARAALESLFAQSDSDYTATETLDDGTPISVRITLDHGSAVVDFTGSGATHPGNRNAPPAVTLSAVLYVLRLLIGEPIPLNEGLLRPITLILPPDTLVNPTFDANDPTKCPAVVGGNVETSQRIVDALLRAIGLCAASQGTMNNTLWGNDAFGYYETVCGGAGATPNAPGASCVHTHMTNTRITDVEIIERRYPVRIERFARRAASGGAGLNSGGDGVVRETVFLAPMSLSLLTERRATGPYGMAGGDNGLPGRQTLVRADEIHSSPRLHRRRGRSTGRPPRSGNAWRRRLW